MNQYKYTIYHKNICDTTIAMISANASYAITNLQ